jgi:hypothetical protein
MGGGRLSKPNDGFETMPDEMSALSGVGAQAAQGDRRSAVRFPIEQDVRYKVFSRNTIEVGLGRTVNMSSNGVLFTTERPLALGERLEVAVNWPAQLDHKCPLKLVTTGRVVRSGTGQAAIAIERYEFRTQGIHGLV